MNTKKILLILGISVVLLLSFIMSQIDSRNNKPYIVSEPIHYKYQIQFPIYYCNGPFTNCYWTEYTADGIPVLHWIDEQGRECATKTKYIIEDATYYYEPNIWFEARPIYSGNDNN